MYKSTEQALQQASLPLNVCFLWPSTLLRKVEDFISEDSMSRLWFLSGFTSIFIDEHERAKEAHIAYVKAVSKDEGLPPEEWALAGVSLNLLCGLQGAGKSP
jgi:hypothetical protein